MMRSLNKVQLIGNIGQELEIKAAGNSNMVNVSVATSSSYKDKNDTWQDTTEWHRVVFWGRLADTIFEYGKKGMKIYIEGKLETRSYEKDGITRYITQIKASDYLLLDKKNETNEHGAQSTKKINNNAIIEDDEDVPF